MELAVATTGLAKAFGATQALDGLDLEVRPGEVHGFLGPNGAGKTTTLRVLLGLLRADDGQVKVLGRDPWREASELRGLLTYVPGEVTLWPTLTGGEVLALLGSLQGRQDPQRLAALVDRFHLDPSKRCRSYSKGNRQKVLLVAALSCDAELYVLDEPTAGLDPLMEAEFRSCITDLKAAGRTVLLSSHILSEAEALCDRVSIIRDGRLVEAGSLADLRHLTGTSVSFTLPAGSNLLAEPHRLERHEGITVTSVNGTALTCNVQPAAVPTLLQDLAGAGALSITANPPTLEELFLRHYGSS